MAGKMKTLDTFTEKPRPKVRQSDGPLRILLAEDHKINRKMMAILLGGPDFALDVVENGAEAISALLENSYDVVLMDIQMPIMDGVTAAREIRKLSGHAGKTPIIAITADSEPKYQQEYLSAGMDGFIVKPVIPEELFAAIEHCVNRTKLPSPLKAEFPA